MEAKRYQYVECELLKLALHSSDPAGYPATINGLLTMLQQRLPHFANISAQELVDTLKRLRPKYLTLWKWSDVARRFIEFPIEIAEDGIFFYRGDFRLRHTPDTDPYVQELETVLPAKQWGGTSEFQKDRPEMYNEVLVSAIFHVLEEVYPDAIDLSQVKAKLQQYSSLETVEWSKAMQVLSEEGRIRGHAIRAEQFEYPVDWRDVSVARKKSKESALVLENNVSAVLVLISHSSKDVSLAAEVTEFLRAGLALAAGQIRCSSVDGYRLPAGVDSEDQLRKEVTSAKVLIGLITPNSLASPYVLFELGARWGANLPMIPLLVGVKPDAIRGPLSSLNALSGGSAAQLHQLLEDISKLVNLRVQNASSYQRYLDAVMGQAGAVSSTSAINTSAQEEMVFEESVYWKREEGGRTGPYCPACYDDKKKKIHLTPGATRGTFRCGICQNSFTTNEYDAKPTRGLSPRGRRYTS